MSDQASIPIVEEEARLHKRAVETERVTVRTRSETEEVVLRDELRREHVELTRVPVDREVAQAPPIRTEGDVTVVPVLEERLVVKKRLFVVEELHLRRSAEVAPVELPATLRRTRVDVERQDLTQEDD